MTPPRLALLSAAGLSILLPQAPAPDPMDEGRALTASFLKGEDLPALHKRLSAPLKARVKDFEGFQAFQRSVAQGLGDAPELIREDLDTSGPARIYRRVVKGSIPVPMEILWGIEADGTISTFAVRPHQKKAEAAPSRFLDYATKTAFRLPFEGEWTVYWGGRTLEQNYHAANASQRFAMDLLVFKEGKSHAGDGKRPEDYYAWGRKILAPAAGKVVAAVDGHDDAAPGVMMRPGAGNPAGNHVVLDHGNGEFSLLAHLQKGSLKVKAGDTVKAGQPLGLCGNSGNTSEPHLHIHLQTGPAFPGATEGLPMPFTDFLADGKPVAKGELVKGMAVRPK